MNKKLIESIYPLSPVQEGMLFHSLYTPESGVYGCQFMCKLRGNLDLSLFEQSWKRVIEQHAVLRTMVWTQKDKMMQVISSKIALPWEEQDWRSATSEQQIQRFKTFIDNDLKMGFYLKKPPLMRFVVIQLKDDLFQFVWSFHHLLLDGWSLAIILKDVFTCYECLRNRTIPLISSPRPYQDYVKWLQRQDVEEAERFWRNKLKGFKLATPLISEPLSLKSQQVGEQYDEIDYRLLPETTTDLVNLAKKQKLTLNSLIQGAWAILLSQYSGDSDIVYGSVVSGRSGDLAGMNAMVGLFINTLPMRMRINMEQRISEWLKLVQDELTELRQYEFSPLVQVQGWSDVTRGQSLFDSVVVFENYPIDKSMGRSNEGIEVHDVISNTWTNYPLSLMVVHEKSLRIRVLYNTVQFSQQTIVRMMNHLDRLLCNMVIDPEAKLGDLSMLTEEERHQLLVEWNDTAVEFPQELLIHQLFEEQVNKNPDAEAVWFEGQRMSYGS